MNEIVNKMLLAGDKFMSEIHLRHPEFTYIKRIIKTNKIKLVFNLIWLTEILKI